MKPKRRRSKSQQNCNRSRSFKQLQKTPSHLQGKHCPTNLQEEKDQFLKYGVTPQLKVNTSTGELSKKKQGQGQISFDLFDEAKTIIEEVTRKYGDEQTFWNAAYGPPIKVDEAKQVLARYLDDNKVTGKLAVYWTPDLGASAKMMWRGPNTRYQKPEARRYSLVIKSVENIFLRERGITCLADHEIGTHFFRMMNEGFQPWYSERTKFGLRGMKSRERNVTEEGLACLNTVINAHSKYLFGAALAYYIACKATTMSFTELFSHLERYVVDKDIRWKYVMRVKRGLSDASAPGGYGRDQCYFEGAVNIIRNMDSIDFFVLYSGSVCVDEVNRVKRLARTECIRTPKFLRDIDKYKKTLRKIGQVNKLLATVETRSAELSVESPDCSVSATGSCRSHSVLDSSIHGAPHRLSIKSVEQHSEFGILDGMWSSSNDSLNSVSGESNVDQEYPFNGVLADCEIPTQESVENFKFPHDISSENQDTSDYNSPAAEMCGSRASSRMTSSGSVTQDKMAASTRRLLGRPQRHSNVLPQTNKWYIERHLKHN